MLVLKIKLDEEFWVGPDVRVKLLRTGPQSASIGIAAPDDLRILRGVLVPKCSVCREPAFPDEGQAVVGYDGSAPLTSVLCGACALKARNRAV